jgi:hypothetical protein
MKPSGLNSKLNPRTLAITLLLMVGILAALMATNSPANLAVATQTCGINGCVSTPPLSSTTSYQYTGTSVSTISSTSTTVSTGISSSTTSTSATTTSTFFSYTSTISTTITTTSYSTIYTHTQTSSNTFISTLSSTQISTATFTNLVTQKGVTGTTNCPVSYVTNGNRLQPYAQFLRNFRNNEIQNTTAGRTFLTTFNAWYYSWAPSATYSAATNPYAYTAIQTTVVPLLGILYASYYTYGFVAPFSSEAAAITSGLVAASLIGLVYVAPIAYVATRLLRRRVSLTRLTLAPSTLWLTTSTLLTLTAYATGSLNLLAFATTNLILSTLSLATLTGTRALAYIQLPFVNPANLTQLLHRTTRTYP